MHAESAKDTMKDWLAGKLVEPPAEGELRHYNEASWPDGTPVEEKPPDTTVYFHVDGTRIDRANNDDLGVGFHPGEQGHIELSMSAGPFSTGKIYTIVFFLYRPTHDDMDLDKLLTFGTPSDASLTVVKDFNKRDTTTFNDAIQIEIKKSASTVKIPFSVKSDAHEKYPADGADSHGRFFVNLHKPEGVETFYLDGVTLRNPKP